jgi:hypothetical protein
MRALAAVLALASLVAPAVAQPGAADLDPPQLDASDDVDDDDDDETRVLPARSTAERYGDALAGTWAGIGLGFLAGAVGLGGPGLLVGCFAIDAAFSCVIGGIVGGSIGGGMGVSIGAGLGAGRGAGLPADEAFFAYGLGFLSALAGAAATLGVGAAIGEGRALDNLLGAAPAAGAAFVLFTGFLTPLFAVALYPDRSAADGDGAVELAPFLGPSRDGLTLGLAGRF